MQRIQLGLDVPAGRVRVAHRVGVQIAEGVREEERSATGLRRASSRRHAVFPLVQMEVI